MSTRHRADMLHPNLFIHYSHFLTFLFGPSHAAPSPLPPLRPLPPPPPPLLAPPPPPPPIEHSQSFKLELG